MTTPLAEISEKAATGETAAIFADIRKCTGLPMVNLIFRHMATIPGCLEWAWANLRPLYTHEAIYRAGGNIAMMAESAPSPRLLRSLPSPPEGERDIIIDTLESYTRGNMLNMIGLFVLTQKGDGKRKEIGTAFAPRPIARIMPLPDLASLPASDLDRLRALTRRTEGDSPLIPSLFRHFATWPEALAAIEAIVGDLSRNGGLDNLTRKMTDAGRSAAGTFPAPSASDAPIVRETEKLAALFMPTMARMSILAMAMRQP